MSSLGPLAKARACHIADPMRDNTHDAAQDFKHLFATGTLGRSIAVKNRFALAPMTRARAGPALLPNDNIHAYYKQVCGVIWVVGDADLDE